MTRLHRGLVTQPWMLCNTVFHCRMFFPMGVWTSRATQRPRCLHSTNHQRVKRLPWRPSQTTGTVWQVTDQRVDCMTSFPTLFILSVAVSFTHQQTAISHFILYSRCAMMPWQVKYCYPYNQKIKVDRVTDGWVSVRNTIQVSTWNVPVLSHFARLFHEPGAKERDK